MIQNITMPQLGESVTEGTIERWLVKPGDKVQKYDPLAEVLTDKVSAEIPSSFEGIVHELIAEEGEKLPVGAVVCSIEVEGEMPKQNSSAASVISPTLNNVVAPKKEEISPVIEKIEKLAKSATGARYSPAVLTLAAEHQIDLQQVVGSGLGGRITRKDIEKIIENGGQQSILNDSVNTEGGEAQEKTEVQSFNQQAEASKTSTGDIEIAVTGLRKTIAKNMVRAKTEIPHAWMMVEVDVTDLVVYRDSIKDAFKEKEGYNITYFAFFVKVVAQALKEFPMINSVWAGDKIIQKKDVNISIAVASEDALFVPVIKHADEKSIKGIAREIHELASKVRSGKLSADQMQGGTFTLNNTGSFGSVQSSGIINYPQAAILQVESIVKRAVIIQDNMFAARHIVNLCLSLDHRILDGLICGKFLQRVKELLENIKKEEMSVY